MKRAWPYAVALAIVVTGCYLALTPLLRSISPGATRSSSSLTQIATTATVGQAKLVTFPSQQTDKVPSQFASDLPKVAKKAKKKADTTAPTGITAPPPTATTGFASGSSSTQAPTRPVVKTKPVKRGSGSVNGTVDPGNGGGLANSGGNDTTKPAGTHSDPAGN